MRYTAIIGGEERLIEVTPRENGYRVVIGGRELDLDAVHLQGFAVSLIAGTRSYRCDPGSPRTQALCPPSLIKAGGPNVETP